ncbi:hypothetical protein VTH82DRAFT_4681 [Thermothelomyces myriococcoides]
MAPVVSTLVFVLSFAFCSLLQGARAACYYPNGDLAPNDSPCQDDSTHATCCEKGYACLSNGICKATGEELQKPGVMTEYVRGSCTDRTWRSSSCPLFCINEEFDNVDSGNSMIKCEGTSDDMYYCVNAQRSSCEDKVNIVYFPGIPSAITTVGVAAPNPSPSFSTTAPTSSSPAVTPTEDSSTTASPGPDKATVPLSSSSSFFSLDILGIVGIATVEAALLVFVGVVCWQLAKANAKRASQRHWDMIQI